MSCPNSNTLWIGGNGLASMQNKARCKSSSENGHLNITQKISCGRASLCAETVLNITCAFGIGDMDRWRWDAYACALASESIGRNANKLPCHLRGCTVHLRGSIKERVEILGLDTCLAGQTVDERKAGSININRAHSTVKGGMSRLLCDGQGAALRMSQGAQGLCELKTRSVKQAS